MGMQEVAIKLNMDTQGVVSSAQNVADAIGKITEKIKEAQKAGDDPAVERYQKQAQGLVNVYNHMASGGQGASGKAGQGGAVGGVVSTANSVTSDVQNIVNKAGSGDVFGAGISGAKSGLDIVGKLGDKAAKAAGGAGLALLPGMLVNSLSQFYEQQMESAMDINARLNGTERVPLTDKQYNALDEKRKQDFEKNGDGWIETIEARTRINSDNIKNAFDQAARAAIKFGYSMEEGMDAVKQAAQHGYGRSNVYGAVENALGWSRATGVDSGTLINFQGSHYHYKDSTRNSLAAAYKINSKTGMSKGQFAETLQALQQVFEEGISKGFVKGTAQIGTTLSVLYKASGNSPLWQGKEGVNRYMKMSGTVESATGLNSVTDILTYKAAASLPDEVKKEALKNAGIKGSYGYIDNMILMEQGVSADLLDRQRKMVEQTAGKGNKEGQIELYKQMYGLNYSGATQAYEMMQKGYGTKAEREQLVADIQNINSTPQYLSDEKNMLQGTEQVRKIVANIGYNVEGIKDKMTTLVLNIGSYASGETGFLETIANIATGKKPKLFTNEEKISLEISKAEREKKHLELELQKSKKKHEDMKKRGEIGIRTDRGSLIKESRYKKEMDALTEQLRSVNDKLAALTAKFGEGIHVYSP